MNNDEPYFEATTVDQVRLKTSFNLSDTSDGSEFDKKVGISTTPLPMKAVFRGAQALERPNARKLIDDGSECYLAYSDFSLYQLVNTLDHTQLDK